MKHKKIGTAKSDPSRLGRLRYYDVLKSGGKYTLVERGREAFPDQIWYDDLDTILGIRHILPEHLELER